MGRASKILTVAEIIEINRRMIVRFGGVFFEGDNNLANPGSLDHVIEEIQGSLFGYRPYPTLIEQASALGWRIIAGHVFHDGNKRTGMEACRMLLELNGYTLRIDLEMVEAALRIAEGKMGLSEFTIWVYDRSAPTG